MSYYQASSFSSQYSNSQISNIAAISSSPRVGASCAHVGASSALVGDSGTRPAYRKAEWNQIAARLEINLRPYVLRYAKLTEEQMMTVVKDAIAMDNIDSENLWFKKSIIKMRINQSTWKHQTLGAIHVGINVIKV